MKFGYKKIPAGPSEAFPKRKEILRPIIPITIEYNGKKIGYEVLIDSGADWNLFHSIMGEVIGIDIAKGKKEKFGGIEGGSCMAYFHEVTIYVGGHPIKVPCGFSPDIPPPPKQAYGILGHIGFFDQFTVKFETTKEELEIKKI